ncbi:MAG TPA: pseudouridine synthase, partial [Terriglobales bacterium]|nr:pseudouridine synthase [Terriglobales bacterium]
AQFRDRSLLKEYRALVWGETALQGSIALSLTHDTRDRKKMRAILDPAKIQRRQRVWPASTRFRRLATENGLSLLRIDMESGVMHQIRVHLAAIGHPLVGDSLYGSRPAEALGLSRHFLHACGLEFRHPRDGRRLRLDSRLPDELEEVLRGVGLRF